MHTTVDSSCALDKQRYCQSKGAGTVSLRSEYRLFQARAQNQQVKVIRFNMNHARRGVCFASAVAVLNSAAYRSMEAQADTFVNNGVRYNQAGTWFRLALVSCF